MQAITLTAPPQAWHVSMSMLNTGLSLYAEVIDAQRTVVVLGMSVVRTFNGMTVFRW